MLELFGAAEQKSKLMLNSWSFSSCILLLVPEHLDMIYLVWVQSRLTSSGDGSAEIMREKPEASSFSSRLMVYSKLKRFSLCCLENHSKEVGMRRCSLWFSLPTPLLLVHQQNRFFAYMFFFFFNRFYNFLSTSAVLYNLCEAFLTLMYSWESGQWYTQFIIRCTHTSLDSKQHQRPCLVLWKITTPLLICIQFVAFCFDWK